MKNSKIRIYRIVFSLTSMLLLCGEVYGADGQGLPATKKDIRKTNLEDPLAAVTVYVMVEDPKKKAVIERKIFIHSSQTWDSISKSEIDRVSMQELAGIKPLGNRLLACVFFIDAGDGRKLSTTKYFPIDKGVVFISSSYKPNIQDLFPEKGN